MSVIAKFLLLIKHFSDEKKKMENRTMEAADITPGL